MYQIGDVIIYGAQGVCRITDITPKTVGEKRMDYYVLQPVYEAWQTIYVPANSETLLAKMRPVLSGEEIRSLIRSMPDKTPICLENEQAKKERYKQILSEGDRTELIRMIKTIYLQSQAQKQKSKKLHMEDERFMKSAEKQLYDEFAHVLHLQRDQVLPFILEQIQQE